MAAAYTFMALNNFHVPELEIIRLCQRAEHEFVGVRCGIMDQFITCLGRSRHALFLDCRTLEYRYLPFPENLRLVIIDTGVKRALASSSYNLRREECAAAARGLSAALPSVQELRDVTPEEFDRHEGLLPPVIRKRCKHVVTENARVLRAVESLRTGNIPEFGKLMYDSHLSLQHDYEVSCPELDALVDICAEASGVYGARMTGAGFGGCAISLVEEKSVAELLARIEREYPMKTGKTPAVYVCTFEDGVALRGTGV
jgi:galactokinase